MKSETYVAYFAGHRATFPTDDFRVRRVFALGRRSSHMVIVFEVVTRGDSHLFYVR